MPKRVQGPHGTVFHELTIIRSNDASRETDRIRSAETKNPKKQHALALDLVGKQLRERSKREWRKMIVAIEEREKN